MLLVTSVLECTLYRPAMQLADIPPPKSATLGLHLVRDAYNHVAAAADGLGTDDDDDGEDDCDDNDMLEIKVNTKKLRHFSTMHSPSERKRLDPTIQL